MVQLVPMPLQSGNRSAGAELLLSPCIGSRTSAHRMLLTTFRVILLSSTALGPYSQTKPKVSLLGDGSESSRPDSEA